MQSLASNYLTDEQIHKLISLLKCNNLSVISKTEGGNSKVLCIQGAHQQWALKIYPPYAPNQRDRLDAESTIYQFLNRHHIAAIPTMRARDLNERWLIIDWISGIIPKTYTSSDIEQAIAFIKEIRALSLQPDALALPLAAEACLSLSAILNQIQNRLKRLQSCAASSTTIVNQNMKTFLIEQFEPTLKIIAMRALDGYLHHHLDPSCTLPPINRSLIPADFGFHNTIRNENNALIFFDFDYFGWDEPVKLLADILWHPKMVLNSAQQTQFIEGVKAIYEEDARFKTRFFYLYPLFGLRWVLILLNEFIPEFWQNRKHADENLSQEDTKRAQLDRATQLLKKVIDIVI